MIKFSHIGQLHNVVRVVTDRRAFGHEIERIGYRGRIKLHGSNASVVCRGEQVQPQSRNRVLSLDDDNLGFAAYVSRPAQLEAVHTLAAELREAASLAPERPLALFGEWIGPGVQKHVAVSQLPARQWVLFAAATLDDDGGEDPETKRYLDVPQLGDRFADASIYSIADAREWQLELDFGHRASLELAAGTIDDLTREVERCCPWGVRFGVEGIGEGLVWQPLGQHFGDSELFFKSKGQLHQVVRQQKPKVSIEPERLASVEAFIAYAVTEARLRQALDVLVEQGLKLEMRSLGAYLKWFGNDVRRECADELEHSGLEWKDVAKAVNEAAKTWFRRELVEF